jgi:hypothetical protein
VPCSTSLVVPWAHRVVGPGTHRGSGPREVHTTVLLWIILHMIRNCMLLYVFYRRGIIIYVLENLLSIQIMNHWSIFTLKIIWIIDMLSGLNLSKLFLMLCWRIKLVSTYDPQAYGPTPFSPRGFPRFWSIWRSRGLQAFDLALLLTYPNPNLRLI